MLTKTMIPPKIGVLSKPQAADACPPTNEPIVIPILKAEIFKAEANGISFGLIFSANCTMYNWSPGTFMKAKKPINKTLIKPNQWAFNVNLNSNKVTNKPTNIFNSAINGW